ncbi:beta-lactamase-like protein [Xylogone sp. PMI_703]|nr:beta-lactamase-like protein [Xylogone sp. PMI_703]
MSNHPSPFDLSYMSPSRTAGSISDAFENPLHPYSSTAPANSMASNTENLLICTACGTQFDTEDVALLTRCRICDDPRQFVPPTGQKFTTLGAMKKSSEGYKNQRRQFEDDPRFWSIWTEPKVAIGQRAVLIRTPVGNVLWDCITFLDRETVEWINSLGGLAAIVISHPHYYTTHLDWAETFDCPVYMSWEDKEWLNRLDRLGKARTFIQSLEEEIEVHGEKTGVKAIKLGGHFPGSLVCLAYERLLIADTLVTTPSALGDWSIDALSKENERPPGMNSFVFMWSIPNMIPLPPEEVQRMWEILKHYEFRSTHGAFVGTDVSDKTKGSQSTVKQRVLESMQIQIRAMGWQNNTLLNETV